jgi:nitrite reductase/ring-hydroxylating ferredoxin subunit/uncharacterized membrane protein
MATVKDVLEGKPLRCPIHPALVHLPIALFPISLLLDLASWIWSKGELYLVQGAFIALLCGLATGVLAAIFGLVDYRTIRTDHRGMKTARLHMMLNVVALLVFAASAALHHSQLDANRIGVLPLILSLVGVGLLGYSGYLGGDLVYSEGINVGRHRRSSPLPQRTIKAATSPSPQNWLAVSPVDSLQEGGTLRVDVGGTIVVIARSGGNIYAFQEFCTHRYGPLSEGALESNQVVCPWHCSKFDVRTGKVTAGPAKVDLHTFRVHLHEGQIWVEPPQPE